MTPILMGDENFDFPVVDGLRDIGYDILTMNDLDLHNQSIPDDRVLEIATELKRVLLTFNRRDFIRLHRQSDEHAGIVVCTQYRDLDVILKQLDLALKSETNFEGKLLRVYKPS